MLKSKPKVQKKLAKIVMASLLLSGVLPGMMSPSVAHAEVATYEIAGTVPNSKFYAGRCKRQLLLCVCNRKRNLHG